MNIRIFGLQNDSIVDGPGIRYAIFTQGCPHRCEGCHNPASHDADGGYDCDTDTIMEKIKSNPLLDGVTFSGGEPFNQAKPLIEIAKKTHALGLNVMAYTGYLWEHIIEFADENNCWYELLQNIDILVDGPFVLAERSIELNFCGSRNQRIIDVRASLESNSVVLYEFKQY